MSAPQSPDNDKDDRDIGPYGPRGKDTPPLRDMFAGYGIILGVVIVVPLLLVLLFRLFW